MARRSRRDRDALLAELEGCLDELDAALEQVRPRKLPCGRCDACRSEQVCIQPEHDYQARARIHAVAREHSEAVGRTVERMARLLGLEQQTQPVLDEATRLRQLGHRPS